MGSKASPGKFDCYANAEPDEPMFVLLGRDRHAPTLVWLWSVLRDLDQEDAEVVGEARVCCAEMIQWAVTHGRKVVGLGNSALAAVLELIRTANHAIDKAGNSPTDEGFLRMLLARTLFEPAPSSAPPQT